MLLCQYLKKEEGFNLIQSIKANNNKNRASNINSKMLYFLNFKINETKYKNRDFGKNKTKSTFRPVGSING